MRTGYKNHYKMKKMRLLILKKANNKCSFCGKYAYMIHHKDLSKDNHSEENLVAVCPSCNVLKKHSKRFLKKGVRYFNRWIGQKDLPQKKIAYLLKISSPMISHLRSGKKLPSLKLARRIEIFSKGDVPMESWIE